MKYILTARCTGDFAGHLTILEESTSEKQIRARKEQIIKARLNKPLFGEQWDRKTLEKELEIWRKVSRC